MIWADLATDAIGILIFLAWLAIPPAYVVILGRHYVHRCQRELEDAESYVDYLVEQQRRSRGRHRLDR